MLLLGLQLSIAEAGKAPAFSNLPPHVHLVTPHAETLTWPWDLHLVT